MSWQFTLYILPLLAAVAISAALVFYVWRRRLSGRPITLSNTDHEQIEEALRQRNQELALLNRISQTLTSTLDLDQVLITIIEEVQNLLGVTACSVWLIDPATDELVCRQATGSQGDIVRGWRLAPGQGFVGWVARSGESLIVPDTRADERHFKDVEHQVGLTLRSIISVPLRIQDNVFGVLQVVDTEVSSFQPTDLTLLEPLAATAAIAIENAQLYRALRKHANQLEQQVQKRTAEVQAQYARLEAILDSVSDGIIVTDVRGEIILVNPVAEAWLTKTLSAGDAAQLREAVRNLTQWPEEQSETVLELEGLDLGLKAAPISKLGAEEAAAVVAVHDISQLKSLDRMKSRFASNVSHELRTPITTIKLYAHLMQQKPEQWQSYLDVLTQEADRQARLVEDVLQMSRIDAGRLDIRPCPTHLNQLTEMAIDCHQALAQEQELTLEHQPAEPGPVALADPERIMQVLNNLTGNAIRYTPEGGKIVISTETKEARGLAWATATVEDTGMGIPEEELPHIFERFFRGETPQAIQIPGTGLGLAIAQEIVKLHGGWITVESQVGKGTTFTVWLPLAPERTYPSEASRQRHRRPRLVH